MSKAVLVIDMPEDCYGCDLRYYDAISDKDYCIAKEGLVLVKIEKCRSDNCPMVLLPEKKPEEVPIAYTHFGAYNDGWNACIDAITGNSQT